MKDSLWLKVEEGGKPELSSVSEWPVPNLRFLQHLLIELNRSQGLKRFVVFARRWKRGPMCLEEWTEDGRTLVRRFVRI